MEFSYFSSITHSFYRRRRLSIEPSKYSIINFKTGDARSPGKALVAKDFIKENELIDYFYGKLLTWKQAKKRRSLGLGGYLLHINKYYVLDCRESSERGECYSSKANNSLHLYNLSTSKLVQANAKITITFRKHDEEEEEDLDDGEILCGESIVRLSLRAAKDIEIEEEICYPYGNNYREIDYTMGIV